jgi:hypothetical protein
VGTGFWIIQAMLLVAAVATAFHVERQNRRHEGTSADDEPDVKVRIEPVGERPAVTPLPLRRERAAPDGSTILRSPPLFTSVERSRLLAWRTWVQQARLARSDLYDDLAPADEQVQHGADPQLDHSSRPDHTSAVRPRWDLTADGNTSADHAPRMRSDDRPPRWPGLRGTSPRQLLLIVGVLLLTLGCVGIWRTHLSMSALEESRSSSLGVSKPSLVAHLTPGMISNPGKYLAAVNSSGSSVPPGADPLELLAMLELRQAMDRFEALFGLGLALIIGSGTGWSPRSPRPGGGDPALQQQSTIASDLVPFIVLVALFCFAVSFFELA